MANYARHRRGCGDGEGGGAVGVVAGRGRGRFREMWEGAVGGQHDEAPKDVQGVGLWRGDKPLTGVDGLKRNGTVGMTFILTDRLKRSVRDRIG